MFNTVADVTLVTLSSAYARWLAHNKGGEPDWTWIEVGIGVAYCLGHAYAYGRRHGGDWRSQHRAVWRAILLGGAPVVIGEIDQWLVRRPARKTYRGYRSPFEE